MKPRCVVLCKLTAKSSTPSPIASTSPAHSNPRIVGVFGGGSIAPKRIIKSWKFKPLEIKEIKGKISKVFLLLVFFQRNILLMMF